MTRGVTPSYGPATNVSATVLGLVSSERFWSETGYVLHFGLALGILLTTNSFFPHRHWQVNSPSRICTQTLREDRGTYINVFLRKWNLILVSCGHIGYRFLAQL